MRRPSSIAGLAFGVNGGALIVAFAFVGASAWALAVIAWTTSISAVGVACLPAARRLWAPLKSATSSDEVAAVLGTALADGGFFAVLAALKWVTRGAGIGSAALYVAVLAGGVCSLYVGRLLVRAARVERH